MHAEITSDKPHHRPGRHPLNRATRWAGRLLCLSLAVSMAGAAVEAFAHPAGSWWKYTWFLVPVLLIGWAILRVLEKRHAGLERAAEAQAEADTVAEAGAGEERRGAELDPGEPEWAGR